jgi:hypothetical protein
MAAKDLPAEIGKPSGNGRIPQIGAAYLMTEVEQEFGDAAHADAADSDEVDVVF